MGGYKSWNSAPRGTKTRLYSKLYRCLYRVLQETKRGPAFRWFTSNGWGGRGRTRLNTVVPIETDRATFCGNKGEYCRHFEKVLPQNLLLFSSLKHYIWKSGVRTFILQNGSHGCNVPNSTSLWLSNGALITDVTCHCTMQTHRHRSRRAGNCKHLTWNVTIQVCGFVLQV